MSCQEWCVLRVVFTSQMQIIIISKPSHFILAATLPSVLKLLEHTIMLSNDCNSSCEAISLKRKYCYIVWRLMAMACLLIALENEKSGKKINIFKADSTMITDLKSAIFFLQCCMMWLQCRKIQKIWCSVQKPTHIIFLSICFFQRIKYLKQCHHSSEMKIPVRSPLLVL